MLVLLFTVVGVLVNVQKAVKSNACKVTDGGSLSAVAKLTNFGEVGWHLEWHHELVGWQ